MVTPPIRDESGQRLPSEAFEAARDEVDPIDQRQRRAALLSNLFDRPQPEITIDRFVVQEAIGAGAMGRVYRAHDPRLERDVAIKLVRRDLLDLGLLDQRQMRMMDEARALAQLDHPNVVSIYEVGEIDEGVFIAMQYVEGPTLREWMHEGPRTWPQIVDVFVRAARGLAAAHARDLVHRDFKPANVFICAEDQEVLVGDFGLARVSQIATTEPGEHVTGTGERTTKTGSIMGTPAYMAPEQERGEPLDGRADQYAFGISLFEALHGHRPEQEPLARPKTVPRWLAEVVARTTAPAPEDRFACMQAVINALTLDRRAVVRRRLAAGGLALLLGGGTWMAATLGSTPVPEPIDPCLVDQERIDQVVNKDSRAGLRATLLATGQSYAETSAETVDRTLSTYAERWAQSRRESCEATWIQHEQSSELLDHRTRCLDGRVAAVESLLNRVDQAETIDIDRVLGIVLRLPPISACDDRERLLAAVPPPSDPDVAERVQQLGRQLTDLKMEGDLGHPSESLVKANALAREVELLDYPVLLARVLGVASNQHRALGETKEAEAAMERALHEAQAAGDDRLAIRLLASLAHDVGYEQERFTEGRRWLDQARAMLRHIGHVPRLKAHVLNTEGSILMAEGELKQALERFELALPEIIEGHGLEHPNVAGVHHNIGNAANLMADYPRALEHYDAALAIWFSLFGENHPSVGMSLFARGVVLTNLERLDEAEEAQRTALKLYERAHGPTSVDVGRVLASLGNVLLARGENERAREYFERALAIFEERLGPDHSLVASTVSNIGEAFSRANDCESAMPHLERALDLKRAHLGERNRGLITTLRGMTWCLLALDRPGDALESAELGIEIRQHVDPDNGIEMSTSVELRGHAELAMGQRSAALASFEHALSLHDDPEATPVLNAQTYFEAARLLLIEDPERARRLAQIARDHWGADEPDKAAESSAWLERSFPEN